VRSLPDGRGGRADYATKANHELIISSESLVQFRDLVGFADYDKASRLNEAISGYRRAVNRERFVARVASIRDDGVEDVYDVSIPG
jgi:ribonucleoside-diphosphate reductase alpha chain